MSEKTRTVTISVTDEQYEYLRDNCIDKSQLLKRLIDIRMSEPVVEL